MRLPLRLIFAAVGLAALIWTAGKLDLRRVLALALESDLRWLGLSIVPVLARFLVWGGKWHRMLLREGPVAFGTAMRLVMAGCFVNLTTPTAKLAGGFLRAMLLHRRLGWRKSTSYGWALADQITTSTGYVLLFGVLAVLSAVSWPSGAMRAAFGGTGTLAIVVVVLALSLRGKVGRAAARPRFAAILARWTPARLRREGQDGGSPPWVGRVLRPLLHQGGPGVLVGDVLLSGLSFWMLCLANAWVLKGLEVEAPLATISLAVVIGYGAGTGLGPWGGIGVTEAALTALFVQSGIEPDAAAAGALIHRATYYVVAAGWGGVALWGAGRRTTPGT